MGHVDAPWTQQELRLFFSGTPDSSFSLRFSLQDARPDVAPLSECPVGPILICTTATSFIDRKKNFF